MDLLDIKRNLNKAVVFTDERLGIIGHKFLLSAVIARKNEAGDFVYTVELSGINANSVTITTLDKIEEVKNG